MVNPTSLGEAGLALLRNPEGGLPILLVRLESGAHSAVLTRCTHRGCQTEPVADRLVCPCHGSEYTLTGRLLEGPAEADLVRYAVHREDDGTLVVAWRPGGLP